ncbi:serine/threonine-protein kinase PRP4 homolog [Actinia tenebrosa]|uniref:Serine/threonine-protein kinase PRP4 homolog n=1 Tax=Actinia tenebrosa TaxID=6105 RepID=A0A6P8HTU2_ACTTE|nr:serine/threonine-protein kinase PRP4 homolog [Actinia tenebrosa]
MALIDEMKKGKLFLLIFTSFFFVTVCDGKKEQKLEHIIGDLKGESDKVANEIYAWIDKHSKGLQSHDHTRHQSRDRLRKPGLPNTHKRGNVEKLIKTIKGESDHLANEIYAWINKHGRGFLSRGKSRDIARDHLRSRRSIVKRSNNGNVLDGESIQDVMLDLMSAPHSKGKRHEKKPENKKTKKSSKRKVNKKSKHATTKRSSKKGNKKNRIQKHVKPVSHSKKSKIPRKKKSSSAHVIKGVKRSGGLANLLKVISADPSKKIVVTRGKNDITLDQKSLKFFNRIPKPVLQKLIENIGLNKFFNIDTYISGEKGKEKTKQSIHKSKAGKTSKKSVAKKTVLKKVEGRYRDEKGSGSAMENSAEEEEKIPKIKAVKAKKPSRKGEKKSSFPSKKAKKLADKRATNTKLRKTKKKEEHADSKSKVLQSKKSKAKIHSNIGHQKLAELKDKIKKTNTLKFKVAKALLEHCETQNKLKKVFDNVNASLKEASQLAKAIGKKFGINKSDLDKLTTKHTEEAVQEFLNKIF